MNRAAFWGIAFASGIVGFSGLAQKLPSIAGTWQLDIQESHFSSGPPPQSMTATIPEESPSRLSYSLHGVDNQGNLITYSWSGPEDGSKHAPLVNGKAGSAVSFTRQRDGSLMQHAEGVDGSQLEAHVTLSPDGNTLTIDARTQLKDGTANSEKHVFHRHMEPDSGTIGNIRSVRRGGRRNLLKT